MSQGHFCSESFFEIVDIKFLLLKDLPQFFNIFRYLLNFNNFFSFNLVQELLYNHLYLTLGLLIFTLQRTFVFSQRFNGLQSINGNSYLDFYVW